MPRAITLLTLIILTMSPVFGLTLEGGVTYTVESARKEAFSGVKYKIPVSSFKKYMQDPNFEENKAAIAAGKADLGDRWIERFSDNSYGVVYKKNKHNAYLYSEKGALESLEIRPSLKYPTKTYIYSTKGMLENVAFVVSLYEAFIYKRNGELYGHWIGDECFDENGNFVLKRL